MSESMRRTPPHSVFNIQNDVHLQTSSSFVRPVSESPRHPLMPWTAPVDFEPHYLGSPETGRQVIYRNWRRKAKPNFRKHVLILDKDPQVLQIAGQLLDDQGFNVTLATRPIAHDLLDRLRPDVILADARLDTGLPGLSSDDRPLVKADGKAVPVIFTTMSPGVAAENPPGDKKVLLKPFDLDHLLEIVLHAAS